MRLALSLLHILGLEPLVYSFPGADLSGYHLCAFFYDRKNLLISDEAGYFSDGYCHNYSERSPRW